MLLRKSDWERWFEVTGADAGRLVAVQAALLAAGFCPCPEIVLGMSRSLLGEADASAKLRVLADMWDRAALPAPAGPHSHWADLDDSPWRLLPRNDRLWDELDAMEPRPARCRRHGRR